MSNNLFAYQRATTFRVHVYLGGLGVQPRREFPTGEDAERDAVQQIREHEPNRRRMAPSSFAHVEYVIPDGPDQGKVSTYARFDTSERHHVRRYTDPDAPGGIHYKCSCGANRANEDEVNTHHEIAGKCAFCWGEEDVHPIVEGRADVTTWLPCPACDGTGDRNPSPPEFDRALFQPDHASYTPRPRPAGRD
uniref:hypothetical protein n=1 Tax=Nonomuraea sp. CA-251285 TaxID=3240002 RepID=UPI003F490BA3